MNPRLEAIAPSIIRELNARKGPGSLDFGLGEPTVKPDPTPFHRATRWVEEHGCPYSPNAGFGELREAIAAHYELPGLGTAANVCVTHGSQEALYLALKALLDPSRDEVLVVEPAYPLYPKLCQLEGIAVRTVGLDAAEGFRPDAQRVLAALGPSTRLVLLASPANPTGRVWPASELETLARGLAERPGPPVWILSDEVYGALWYGDAAPVSPAVYHPYTVVANSLSKSHALTGLRLGWLLAPADVTPLVVKAHQFLTTAASTFSQRVAREVFREPASWEEHRRLYRDRLPRLREAIARAELEAVAPEGAFYCMVKLGPRWAADSLAAAHRLIDEADVVAVPGRAFGDAAEGWLRLSWCGDPATWDEGLARLARTVGR